MALACTLGALRHLDQTDPDAVQALLQSCTSALLSPRLWAWALVLTLLSAVVGGFIGAVKGRWQAGFFWSLALGPIGWIVIVLAKTGLEECAHCGRGNIPTATTCRHCGFNLRAAARKSERAHHKHNDSGRGW